MNQTATNSDVRPMRVQMKFALILIQMLLLLYGQGARAQTNGWVSVGLPNGDPNIGKIVVAPDNDNFWVVGTSPNNGRGIYITTNGGATWTHPAAITGLAYNVAIDPTNINYIYASSVVSGTISDLYVSADKGSTWTRVDNGVGGFYWVGPILVSSVDGKVFVASRHSAADSKTDGLWSSSNHGSTWTWSPFNVAYSPSGGLTVFDIEEDPANNALYVAGQIAAHPQPYTLPCTCPLLASFDRGATWRDVSGGFGNQRWHAAKIQVDPQTHDVYAQLEGNGIWRSSDRGATWRYLNNNGAYYWDLLLDPKYPNRIFASVMYNVYASTDSAMHFRAVGPGVTSANIPYMALNHASTKLVASIAGSGIYVTTVTAGSCLPSTDCPSNCGAAAGGACYDPATEAVLTTKAAPYVGGLARSTNTCVGSICPLNQVSLVIAESQSGYQFDHWEGDLAGSVNPGQLTMSSNKMVSAVFIPTGARISAPVIVDSINRYAMGALGTARNSADASQSIGCTTTGSVSSLLVGCSATNASGVTVSCSSSNPALIANAKKLKGDSFLYFSVDASGQCSYILVKNASGLEPKRP